MAQQLSEDLLQFRSIILSLVSYASHPKLDSLINKHGLSIVWHSTIEVNLTVLAKTRHRPMKC